MSSASIDIFPAYAVVGADRFLRNERVAQVLAALQADDGGPTRFDGERAELAEVLDELRTFSLLGGRRVVLVDEADAFISAHRAALERYCAQPADDASLILLCNSLPSNTKLYKAIHKIGAVFKCEPLRGRAVYEFVMRRAESVYGKRLSRGAAQALVEHVGPAPGGLDAELSKLASFVGKRDEISPGDIDALTGRHREEKVFAVTDAIAAHDVPGALRHWEQVLATDRAAPGRAVAGLAWGVRRLLEARREWQRGGNLYAMARRMYTDPDVLKQRLERVSVEQLEAQQSDLLAADLAVKTGGSTVAAAVEKFIVTHGAPRRAAG